jgi:hypothetical protein
MSISFRLINFPVYTPTNVYQHTIERISSYISKIPGFRSVYNVGNISDPGISDIDLLVIFSKDSHFKTNPLNILHNNEKYLFSHFLFGCTEDFIGKAAEYYPFNSLQKICGENFFFKNLAQANSSITRQLALEFLTINYISRNIEYQSRIISIRNVFLSVKAILHDIKILEISDITLNQLIIDLIEIRKNWFLLKNSKEVFLKWYQEFIVIFNSFFESYNANYPIFLTDSNELWYSRNVKLRKNSEPFFKAKRFLPTLYFTDKQLLLKRYTKFSSFYRIDLNWNYIYNNKEMIDRCEYAKQIWNYNRRFFPFFQPPVNKLMKLGC